MMLKNNRGITLITLIYMIIIILILTSIFIATSLNSLEEARNSEIENELHVLEQAINERFVSYIKNDKSLNVQLTGNSPSANGLSETDCVNIAIECTDYTDYSTEDIAKKKQKISDDISRDYDDYVKIISKSEAKALGIEPFSEENIYMVDYYTAKAYGPINKYLGDE